MTFRMFTKLARECGEMQVASLKYCMIPEAEDIMGTFNLSHEEQKNVDTVLGKFDDYFQPRKNILRLRKQIAKRVQTPVEPVEAFSRALHVQATDREVRATKVYTTELRTPGRASLIVPGVGDDGLESRLVAPWCSTSCSTSYQSRQCAADPKSSHYLSFNKDIQKGR